MWESNPRPFACKADAQTTRLPAPTPSLGPLAISTFTRIGWVHVQTGTLSSYLLHSSQVG